MQTLPTRRVYTLQVDERGTAAHALIETMLNPAPQMKWRTARIEVSIPSSDTNPRLYVFS